MKKTRVLWIGAFLAVLFVVMTVFFLGRTPVTVPVWSALPAVGPSVPYLLLTGKGTDVPSRDLLGPLEEALPAERVRKRMHQLLPFLERAEQYSLLLALEEGIPQACGAIYPHREDLAPLDKGELPPSWQSFFPGARIGRAEGEQALFVEGWGTPVLYRVHDGMVLFAHRPERLDRMASVLEGDGSPQEISWSLHPEWSSHLGVHDAGQLGDIFFMGGLDVGTAPLSSEVAWQSVPEGNHLAWKVDGVGDLLAKWGFAEKRSRETWARVMTLSSPSLLTLGVNCPPEFFRRFGSGLQREWADDLGLSSSQTETLLTGPMVFSLGGRSKLFLFSAPGAYLQLFDRGELGRELVDRLWSVSWPSLEERREPVAGFPFGGGVFRPFSVVGAARPDRVIVGLLDPAEVRQERVPARFLPFDPGESALWFYGDFPELASTLKKWARLGNYARSAGFEIGEMEETFDRIEKLRSLGKVTLTLRNPFEGTLSWTGDVR